MNSGGTEKRLLDILKCSRPVLFVNADRDWPVSVGGTAFVVLFHGRHFVITAKHVSNLETFGPEQLRVQYRRDLRDFMPLRNGYLVSGVDSDDTDQYQVAVWDLDEGLITSR